MKNNKCQQTEVHPSIEQIIKNGLKEGDAMLNLASGFGGGFASQYLWHGIEHETITSCGFKYLIARDHNFVLGRNDIEYVGIGIPHYDLDGETLIHVSTMALTLRGIDGKKLPKYLSRNGAPDRAYFPPLLPWLDIAANPSEPITIYDDVLKAIRSCERGIPGIADFGLADWKKRRKAGKDAALMADIAPLLQGERKISFFDE